MSNPSDFTIGLLCALSTEDAAATAFLDETYGKPEALAVSDNNSYTHGRMGEHNVVIAVLPDGEYGISSAASVARDMLRSYPNMRFGLMVGIGGGAPSRSHDIRLGDIVVSSSREGTGGVFQYDFGKTIEEESFKTTGVLSLPPTCLRTATSKLKSRHYRLGHEYESTIINILEKYPKMRKMFSRPDQLSDKLFRQGVIHPKNNKASCEEICSNDAADLEFRPERTKDENNPAIHYGPIASANRLMMDSKMRDKLAAEKGVLCFEMEAAGIMNHFPCLVIRGICDYADSHRNKEWQGYAAMTAVAYAKDLLCEISPRNVMAEQRIIDTLAQVASTVDNIKHQLDNKEDLEILDWITPSEYGPQQSDFINRRQTGTCQWLLDSEEYKTWLTASNQTLFCPGIPGTGKTILTAAIVDNLTTQTSNNLDIGLAYIYCNFKRQGTQMFEDLAASLLKQLSRKMSSLPVCVKELYYTRTKERTKPTENEVTKALRSVAAMYSKIFIVIDALDECEASNHSRSKFLSLIFDLRSHAVTNLFATSRYIPDIENQFKGSLKREIIASDGDMRRFISANMQHLPSFLSMRFGIQEQEEIKSEIIRAAQGMFLLVELYFKSLISKTSISEVKSFLRNLHNRDNEDLGEDGSRDLLNQAYREAMERVNHQARDRQRLGKRVISWITFAKRPLQKLELQHALAVKFKDIILDEDNVREVGTIVSVCAGLVTVDEESGIIRLVHHTTQEYFNQTQNHWFPDSEAEITRVCCTYLSFSTFENGCCQTEENLDERLQLNPFYDYAATNWGYHAHSMEEISKEVIDFITCPAKVEASSQVLMGHLVYDLGTFIDADIKQTTGLHLAAFFGLSKALHFLPQDKQCLDLQDCFRMAPLSYAVNNGHEDAIRLLLEKGATVDAVGPLGMTALSQAVMEGKEGIVRLLLDNGADIEAEDEDGDMPLHHAIESKDITQLLLSKGAAIDAPDMSGNTPLLLAAINGKENIVRLLLQERAAADAKDESGRTSLIHAIIKNHEHIVRLLLAECALLEERDALGRTPLFIAAESGHVDIVRLLLKNDADIEARDASGRTPLFVAAESGNFDIVWLLFEEGADIQARDMYGRTPLLPADWKYTYRYHSATTRMGRDS